MAKNPGSKSASKRVKVKNLSTAGKKLSKKEQKQIRGGGDFNQDGEVDGADFLALKKTAQKVRV